MDFVFSSGIYDFNVMPESSVSGCIRLVVQNNFANFYSRTVKTIRCHNDGKENPERDTNSTKNHHDNGVDVP